MISEMIAAKKAYVWIWLPGQTEPVVAGKIEKQHHLHVFTYGQSYRNRKEAISLSPFELPLQSGTFEPIGLNHIHSCLRDAAPDAWGRRVVYHQYPHLEADELDYMLLSGSNRIGALDFQHSDSEYIPRNFATSNLDDLLQAAEFVDKGEPLPSPLEQALLRGTSIGGARPKCLIEDNERYFIAKFPLASDQYDIIKAEYISMRLASLSLQVPKVYLKKVLGKNVLLIERFDRKRTLNGTVREGILSGLSLLGLNEMEARYASYSDLANVIRQHFKNPHQDLAELYKRLIFNILIGNTDDHARNHSAFWDGARLNLTPAYDLCPQPRSGQEATQAMSIEGIENNFSTLTNILSIADKFLLSKEEAKILIEHQITIIQDNWKNICEEAELASIEEKKLWNRAVLNPFCFYGWK